MGVGKVNKLEVNVSEAKQLTLALNNTVVSSTNFGVLLRQEYSGPVVNELLV